MSEKLKTHKALDAWKRSMDLVGTIYKDTKAFSGEELYRLINQLRRVVVFVPSNIAEGAARSSQKEFIQFLHTALGSVSEVERQLAIAKRLGYLDNLNSIEEQIQTVRKLILGLIPYLRREDGNER